MTIFLTHLALALALFLTVNAIGRRAVGFGYLSLTAFAMVDEAPAFNFLFRVLAPAVYLVIFATSAYLLGFDQFVERSYLIVVYYVVFRLAFNVGMGRALLLNWWNQALVAASTIAVAYGLHVAVIRYRVRLIPDAQTIAAEVWLVVILFAYHVANSVRVSSSATQRRKAQFLRSRLHHLHRLYGDLVFSKATDDDLRRVIYALLIVEGFNRPKAARLVEYLAFPFGLSKTLGIMQVSTDKPIGDRESVELGIARLNLDFEAARVELTKRYEEAEMTGSEYMPTRVWQTLRAAVVRYNPDGQYADDVMSIAGMLEEYWPDIHAPVLPPAQAEVVTESI